MSKLREAALSKTQSGIYVECMQNPEYTMYNCPFLGKLGEDIDVVCLKGAIERAIKAHPCLETTIYTNDSGEPIQRISEGVCTVDMFEMTDREFEEARNSLVRPFELNGGRLARFELYITPSASYYFEDIHHIITDGVSLQLLADSIRRAYDGEELSEEEYTGLDVAADEAALIGGESYNRAKLFYEGLLDGCDGDCLPVRDICEDKPEVGQGWLVYEFKIDKDRFKALRNEVGVSTTAFFTTVMGFLVAKYNYRDDSVIATIYNGRNSDNKQKVLSMLVKTMPFVTDISGNPTIRELLKRSMANLVASRENDIYSFEEVATEFGVNADINFGYQGHILEYQLMRDSNIEVERIYDDKHIESTALLFELSDKNDGNYLLHIGYRTDMYSREFAENMGRAYAKAAQEFLERERVDEVELTDEAARAQLDAFNNTEYEFDHDKTLIDLFREKAKAYPDNTAVVYLDKHLTYRELDNITDILARNLRQRGIGKEVVAGVLIPRCEYMVICALGVLKAGGGYLPLDPTYPPERLNLMLKDSGAKLLITTEELLKVVEDEFEGDIMLTEEIMSLEDSGEALPSPEKGDLFIMLYTSGSTGLPKGVMLEHGNIATFCDWARRYYSIDESSRNAAYASYGFDANMFDTYPVLTAGGTLYIIDESIRLNLLELQKYFNDNKITHSFITTQVGRPFALMEGTKTLKHLTIGGEKLVPLAPPSYNLYNAYGPTECTVLTTVTRIDKKYADVPIGPALDNFKLYVVDKNGKLLPQGAAGELWAAGYQIGRAYLNRPEQTAKAFTANPFCDKEGYDRVYHTGDVVRLLNNGSVQFIGRRDSQVKVRGFRIELTEVEEIIRKFDGIKDATVAAFDEPAGGKYIAAYIVSDEKISIEALNDFIRAEKPPYMVPAVTMQIDKIPINQNQKVNKRALPVPERKFENVKEPQNETQQRIFNIVADVIGSDSFGVNTDIYLAGLTSIGALKLNVLLSREFDIAVATKDLKENNTVERLESFIMSCVGDSGESVELFPDYGITKTQEGIFVESMAQPQSCIYNIPILLELSDNIDLDRLRSAVKEAVNAHPYIKTRLFMDDNGDIRQRRNDDESFDESDIELIEAESIDAVLDKDTPVNPFTLMGGRLFRFKLIKADKNYLFADMHHIISDGTSMVIFFDDVSRAYRGESLEREKYSGFEVSLTEKNNRSGEHFANAEKYYTDIFEGCDVDCLPQGDLKEQETALSADIRQYASYSTAEDVRYFCEANRLTMNGFFTAAFGLTLAKFCRKEKTVFASIYNGRNDSRLERTMAMLVKTLPVMCSLSKENATKSVKEYVLNIGNQLMDSMSNDIYSFSEIKRKLGVNANVMFAYQGEDFGFNELCGERVRMLDIASDAVKAPLNLNVFLEKGRIRFYCEYRSDRYSRDYIESFLDAYDMAVSEMLKRSTVGEVYILSEAAERELEHFNDTVGEVERLTPPQLFERQVELNPKKTAVTSGGISLSFKELNLRANRVANTLIQRGVKADTIVGLYMNRCVDVYAVRQGIMKSGGAFLSTEPEYPDERIAYIFENSLAKLLITTAQLYEARRALFDSLNVEVLLLEDIYKSDNTANPSLDISPSSLAYCIYTSGSTGKPKGVMIEHRNLMNMLAYHDKNVLAKDYVDNTSVFLALAAITFDVSVIEEMMPLYHGQSVAMATEEEIHNPLLLARMMKANGVDMMKCTPSYMQTMLDFDEVCTVLKQLKAVIIGAEPFPVSLYDKMRKAGFEGIIFNSYGPTETTVTVTIDELDGKSVTIGRPAGNTKVYMLDSFGNVLPKYAQGELTIVGDSVGRGYIGLEEATKEKFVELNGQRAYRSGDVAYWNSEGKIVHCGRMDNQVKLRGLRVELDEIENVMNRFEGIKRSVVLVKGNQGDEFLCGYYVAENEVDTAALTAFMAKTLTKYMLPKVFVHLKSLPMTVNGKVDKRALPEPEQGRQRLAGREGRNDLERRLCDIFAKALGTDKVYADDDFFELGGTSLSASKVAMKCMTENIPVVYANVFDYTTPATLAAFVSGNRGAEAATSEVSDNAVTNEPFADVLKYNQPSYVDDISYSDIGSTLVTGATGYLGIHIVKALLDGECERIYCLVRHTKRQSSESRLKMLLMYYFDDTFENELGTRLIPIDGDITDDNIKSVLAGYEFDTVINCAACVKHFVNDDLLDRVNVHGVENLIEVCRSRDKRLIQISTVSVGGESVNGSVPEGSLLRENTLNLGQNLDNKYAETKFRAEMAVLEAVRSGLRAKIIRVGNLMSREKDGEFQINYSTNGFMKRLRAYAIMGSFPVGSMDMPAEFSPIDLTAQAILLLAGTADKFTLFHACNCHYVHMANVLEAMRGCGIDIKVKSDDEFKAEFNEMLADERRNMDISSLIAYLNNGSRRYVAHDTTHTVKALYRLGFSWQLTDNAYIRRAINALATLGFFDYE
jgi:amino acid adenylation domain-containing protein/thioester reductase-like protein